MAKEKKWVDCPICGSRGSMRVKKHLREIFETQGYAPIKITNLEGQFCKKCDEGFWSLTSRKIIRSTLAEKMAKQDSGKVVASQLTEINTLAEKLDLTRQRVHQMMNEGKLRYVFIGKTKVPLKIDDHKLKKDKKYYKDLYAYA